MEQEPTTILAGDPKRRADDTVRGFLSQFWHTVHAWLDLGDGDLLIVEGAEDFDVIKDDVATATQVKATAANLTLRSGDVIDAIRNFWSTRQQNPGRKILYRFLSTSQKGQEQNAPFGADVRGLDVWEQASRDHHAVELLRAFFVSEQCFDGELNDFIKSAPASELIEQLISRITWDLGAPDLTAVEEAVRRKLIEHGADLHVPARHSETVASRLLKDVANAAAAKEPRTLHKADFLRAFDDETHVTVSRAQHTAGVAALMSLISGSSPGALTLDVRALAQSAAPPLPQIYAPRLSIVEQANKRLNLHHVVCFQGSTGTGKTILANLTVRARSPLLWAPFSGLSPRETALALRAVARAVDADSTLTVAVLDDVNFEPLAFREYDTILLGLLYTIRARRGDTIITAQRTFPSSLLRTLDVDEDVTISVPAFARSEIQGFAEALGAPPQRAQEWSLIVEVKSGGHPQLVHAHLLALRNDGWPPLDAGAIFDTPEELVAERTRARLLLSQVADDEKRLLYRLSLIGGAFRRDHAIAIASLAPKANLPGDSFDRLVGPWIEPVSATYFRLSPLLGNAAAEVWTPDEVKAQRAAVGTAVLSCGKLTNVEANEILMLGFVSRSEPLVATIVSTLLRRNLPLQRSIAESLSWLTALVTTGPVFPENPHVNWMVRTLQFHVAATVSDRNVQSIAERLDIETTSESLGEHYQIPRLLSLLAPILAFNTPLPVSLLLRSIAEVSRVYSELQSEEGEFGAAIRNIKTSLARLEGEETRFGAILFGFVSIRCDGAAFLATLLNELRTTHRGLVDDFREFFDANDTQGRMLIDRAWTGEDKDKQDWPNCIAVFKDAIQFASEFDIPSLADAAVRALVIVYDEYLEDRGAAFEVINTLGADLKAKSQVFVDAHATLLSHDKRYDEAMKVWDSVLSTWQVTTVSSDSSVVFAHRKAGMAAANNNEFPRASAYYSDGVSKADAANLPATAAGLLADSAFSAWRAGDFPRAVSLYVDVLKRLDALPNDPREIASFRVRKVVGQMLLHIRYSAAREADPSGYAPPVGAASNPETDEKWRAFPVSPPEQLWLMLAQIETIFGLPERAMLELRSKVPSSILASVRWFAAELEVRRAISASRFDELPALAQELGRVSRITLSTPRTPAGSVEAGDARLVTASAEEGDVGVAQQAFVAALLSAVRHQTDLEELLARWDKVITGLVIASPLKEWISDARVILRSTAEEAVKIARSDNEKSERRVLAAVRMIIDRSLDVENTFYGHVTLMNFFAGSIARGSAAESLAEIFAETWRSKMISTFALRSPKLTVPRVMDACNSDLPPLQKSAAILLAAQQAIGIRLPAPIQGQLEKIAADPSWL